MRLVKLLLHCYIVTLLIAMPVFGLAQDEIEMTEPSPVTVYFFWGEGCPHCEKEKVFLRKLEQELNYLTVKDYETWNNRDNAKLLVKLGKELGIDSSGVPLTIIGEEVFVGYFNDEVTGVKIREVIEEHSRSGCDDVAARIIAGIHKDDQECTHGCAPGDIECQHDCGCEIDFEKELPEKITLPLFGEVNLKNFSLPVLTMVIAALDGFNPCAMWVLIFLISLLINMKDKRRMWILGSSFIGASALMYFLFLTAWLNLFLFLGFIFWVRLIVGLVAIGSGVYHLREYWVNREAVCKVTGSEKRRKVFEKLRRVTQQKSFAIALIGIIILAFAVNLVELVCSAGLPAVYTNILSLSNLPGWQYYAYLVLYILIFMADDLLVFFVAMKTLQMTGVSHKYSRLSNLIGGIIILALGVLLLFKPGWLMFG